MEQETEFLIESNAIENVYDDDSLEQAKLAWEFLKEQDVMSVHVICKVHKILMLNQNIRPDELGYFRKRPVYIGRREATLSERIPDAMKQWILNANDLVQNGKNEKEGNTEWLENMCKAHHVEYERIHPFIDGNGRTGRMFMNWQRLKLGLPILIIHEGAEQMEYYGWFR